MTAREKVLAGVLGSVVLAGVAGVGGYVALYKPVADKLRAADAMARETEDKRFRLAVLRKDLARLPAAQARSLPSPRGPWTAGRSSNSPRRCRPTSGWRSASP